MRPTPDPTVLTTEALVRAVAAERDYVDGRIAVLEERLRAIDVATRLLNETVNRVPTDVNKEVTHLRELMDERLQSVAIQFAERDTRQERESRDNSVKVDAAFAAQKEAAAKQDEGNQKQIDKSERATNEAIRTLGELFRTTTDALKDSQTKADLAISALQTQRQGGDDGAAVRAVQRAQSIAIASVLVAAVGIVVVMAIAFLAP